MKLETSNVLLLVAILSISTIDEAYAFNPIKRFIDMIKRQLKSKEKTRNNFFDDSVVYAIPSYDGHGFILKGYGKPDDPYKYDNNVDIYQKHKMWSGRVKIPNMFQGDDYSSKKDRIVKGFDNRLGFRVAVPFLGDFQYLREIGPGRFTDNLGPGDFPYPGYKDKKSAHAHHDDPYSHDAYGYGNYGPYGDLYGTNGLPYGHPDDGPVSEHAENYHVDDPAYHYSGSEIKEVYSPAEDEAHTSKEVKPDIFEGMRNYPWNK